MPLLIFASRIFFSNFISSQVAIWDIQTGVVINSISFQNPYSMVFVGNQRTIALLTQDTFCAYDSLTGTPLYDGTFQGQLGAGWAHGESLRFVASSNSDGKFLISVYELQPTSSPPLVVVDSFPIPFNDGKFYFSPKTFHASFVASREIVFLDVRDSKIILRVEMSPKSSSPNACFSSNGRLFACQTQGQQITVWENTSAGYVTRSILRPRLPLKRFCFSPSGTSILGWGRQGTQLLDIDGRSSAPPVEVDSDQNLRRHLVVYSEDRAHVITARQGGSVVTVLDTLSGAPQRSFDTNIQIMDLGIVGDTVYITDTKTLVSRNLEAWGTVQSARGTGRATVNLAAHTGGDEVEYVALSRDCSQIAFATHSSVFLYDARGPKRRPKRGPKILGKHTTYGYEVTDILFSPGGSHLYVIALRLSNPHSWERHSFCFVKLETGVDRCFVNETTSEDVVLHSRHGYGVGNGSEWVEGPGGGKVLWLPPGWRTKPGLGVRWDGNFLALVGGNNPVPIIIEFQP